MVNDIKTTFTHRVAGFESFSIALDESTDLSDTAQLAIFIRGVDKEFTVTEELLALQPLKGTTAGEDIYNEVRKVIISGVKPVIFIPRAARAQARTAGCGAPLRLGNFVASQCARPSQIVAVCTLGCGSRGIRGIKQIFQKRRVTSATLPTIRALFVPDTGRLQS
ncbi:General transcription factor II-I repeat domain-containing protein 2A [Eumeta japonica]|uniref:General transcription factor II-I repeat domain-containing protein 2A n=1 Tax=Eumeta variegata TaxID=151549 RepID=A0A4C1UIB6_EUMVA|nr:General transcription factor II-I repeat domain-containing protein 2A [Eumeta japonica]